jgi:outer membrane lipoprotein carrier protein
MKALFFTLAMFVSAGTHPKPAADSLKPLKDTLTRLRQTRLVDFKVEKKVVSELMGNEKVYQGRAYLSGSLIRFETETPEKSLVVFDGRVLWIVQYPDPVFGGKRQVLRGKVQGKQKEQILLTELLTKGRLVESFDVTKTGEENGLFSYEAKPRDKSFDLQKVDVQVKSGELRTLSYVDDVGNKTTLSVTEQKLLKESRPEIFKFKPNKDDQVTDL